MLSGPVFRGYRLHSCILVEGPISEEIIFRWFLPATLKVIFRRENSPNDRYKASRETRLPLGNKGNGVKVGHASPKLSTRLVSCLSMFFDSPHTNAAFFGFAHAGRYLHELQVLKIGDDIFKSNSLMFHYLRRTLTQMAMAFFVSLYCVEPVYRERGLVAAISAHATCNFLGDLGIL